MFSINGIILPVLAMNVIILPILGNYNVLEVRLLLLRA